MCLLYLTSQTNIQHDISLYFDILPSFIANAIQEEDSLYRVPTELLGWRVPAAGGLTAPLTGPEPIRSNTHRRPGRYPALGTGFNPPCEDVQRTDDIGVVFLVQAKALCVRRFAADTYQQDGQVWLV